MKNAEQVFKTLVKCRHGFDWSGEIQYKFWGGKPLFTSIEIDYDITYPTQAQLAVLERLISFPKDIRPRYAKAVFKYYQSEVYGSVSELGKDDDWEDLTPKLSSPDELMELLGDPAIRIRYLSDDEPPEPFGFRFGYMDCPWDNEHGFGVRIEDWKIVEFGGEAG